MLYKTFTVQELREKFHYDSNSGEIYWKAPHRYEGKRAGSYIDANGGYLYLCMGKGGKVYSLLGHRVIWALIHGEFPPEDLYIDHIDGDVRNNKSDNLRIVDARGNSKNKKPRKQKATSRYVHTSISGIRFDKQKSCYVVEVGSGEYVDTIDFDDAKYIRWNWEYDNGFHELHSVK